MIEAIKHIKREFIYKGRFVNNRSGVVLRTLPPKKFNYITFKKALFFRKEFFIGRYGGGSNNPKVKEDFGVSYELRGIALRIGRKVKI